MVSNPKLAPVSNLVKQPEKLSMFDTDVVTIYHNPRCSKSRQTLELLQSRHIQPRIVEYLKTPPSKQELNALLDLLALQPRDIIRSTEQEYTSAGLSDMSLERDALLQALLDYPKLLQRPIVVANGKAAIGRPPEQVLDILDP